MYHFTIFSQYWGAVVLKSQCLRINVSVLANSLVGENSWLFSVTGKYKNVDCRLLKCEIIKDFCSQ